MITRRTPDEPATMTVEEAARVLGIGRTLAYEAARRGELPTLRFGRRLLVPLAALDQLLCPEPRCVTQDERNRSPIA